MDHADTTGEPLLNHEYSGTLQQPPFGEPDFLRILEDVEAHTHGYPEKEHTIDDDEVFKMRQLIREKPKDVLQYIEEEGVVKVGEFDVQDSLAFAAFGKDSMLTMGHEHFECDWEAMWRERLSEAGNLTGIGWTTTVTMEALVVNLRDAAADGSRGLLHPLLKRYQVGGCPATVFALPAVQAVIQFKWRAWARRFLVYELVAYLIWLTAFTVFTLIFQHEDWSLTFWQLLGDWRGITATAASAVCLVAMAPFVWMEVCTVAAYRGGWLTLWNVADVASYVLQVAICVLHLQRSCVDEGWFSVLVATQTVFMWSKLQYFARVFNPTRTLFMETIRVVFQDLKWVLLFLLLTLAGFAVAFYALFRQDREKFVDFRNLWHSFSSMYAFMLAMFDLNVFYNSTNPIAAMVLFMVFEFLVSVVILNILVALTTTSFQKALEDEGLRLLCSKAEVIDELEATVPRVLQRRAWYPAFIHFLKFHPETHYEVNLSALESNLLNAQHETRLRVEEYEEKIARIDRKLDAVLRLLLAPPNVSGAPLSARAQPLQQSSSVPTGQRSFGSTGGRSVSSTGGGGGAQRGSSHSLGHLTEEAGEEGDAGGGGGADGLGCVWAAAHSPRGGQTGGSGAQAAGRPVLAPHYYHPGGNMHLMPMMGRSGVGAAAEATSPAAANEDAPLLTPTTAPEGDSRVEGGEAGAFAWAGGSQMPAPSQPPAHSW